MPRPQATPGVPAYNVSTVAGIRYTPSSSDLPSYTTASVFEAFPSGAAAGTKLNTAVGGVTESYIRNGDNPTLVANYLHTNGLALLIGNPLTFTFENGIHFFSFVGNLDSTAYITFQYADRTTQTLTGLAMAGSTNPGLHSTEGRFSYDTGAGRAISSVTLGSADNLFAIDDVAAAVPEADAWAMLVLGVGMLRLALRRRRSGDQKPPRNALPAFR